MIDRRHRPVDQPPPASPGRWLVAVIVVAVAVAVTVVATVLGAVSSAAGG